MPMDIDENIDDFENLENLTRKVSNKLSDSFILIETLMDAVELNRNSETIIYMVKDNIRDALDKVETCRKLISVPDR